jgi:glycosyltransferase involved in cell wall biosynthesis
MNSLALIYQSMNNRIYIDNSFHPFFSFYNEFPPVAYARQLAPSCSLKHLFNRTLFGHGPFIVEYEHLFACCGASRDYSLTLERLPVVLKHLSSQDCRSIVVPSRRCKSDTVRYAPHLQQKIHVLRPGTRRRLTVRPRSYHANQELTLLHISNKYIGKGTFLVLEIFRRLRQILGNSIVLNLVCNDMPIALDVPEGVSLFTCSQLGSELKEHLFVSSDLFVFPCLHDSYGVYQECSAFGLPVLTTDIFDKSEIVLNGLTGFLFDTPYQLYSEHFGTTWKTWDQFCSIMLAHYKRGAFEGLIMQMTNVIVSLADSPELLSRLSLQMLDFCDSALSPEARTSTILNLYHHAMRDA